MEMGIEPDHDVATRRRNVGCSRFTDFYVYFGSGKDRC
jgi:hypothetical protein